jgi:predicted AlkP superfamily phosphohydrolase/phosphomutase
MKVLILGIDALEYNLVEEWDLKNIKQNEYGKIKVPITNNLKEPATEIVWPCFITGKEPVKMGYTSTILYRQPFKWFFENIYTNINSKQGDINPETILDKRTKKREFLDLLSSFFKKAGFSYHPTRTDIEASTIFDNKDKKIAHFHIPVYDKDVFPEYRKDLVDVISKKIPVSEFTKSVKKSFNDRCKELIEYLENNKDWDLIMMYWFCLDGVQHAFFKNKLKIMDFYMLFNEFVETLKKKLPSNVFLLIISDHGQEKGIHTDHGFYSSNIKIGMKKENITDFKKIIEKKLYE